MRMLRMRMMRVIRMMRMMKSNLNREFKKAPSAVTVVGLPAETWVSGG